MAAGRGDWSLFMIGRAGLLCSVLELNRTSYETKYRIRDEIIGRDEIFLRRVGGELQKACDQDLVR